MVDRSKNSMLGAIVKLIKSLQLDALKTLTSVRGKEFACYVDVKKGINFIILVHIQYAKVSNEISNGLLKEYYPKKTDLSKISIN